PRRPVLTRRAPRALALALSLGLLGAGPAALEVEGPGRESVALAPREGRALVVHFWATWCPSCRDEAPGLSRAAAVCPGTVDVARADGGEDGEAVRRFAGAQGIAVPIWRDPKGRAWRASAGGWGLPANLLWTGDGRRSEVGPKSAAQWRDTLARLGCAQT